MDATLPRILGVRLHLYPFWLLALALLGLGIFAIGVPGTPEISLGSSFILGVAGALALVISYAVHELSHGVVSRRLGLPVDEVPLFAFADQRQPPVEPTSGGVESISALAGIVVSLVLAGLFGAAWLSVSVTPTDETETAQLVSDLLWWAAAGNLALGMLNSALSYPYDGGRVVRGVLWSITHDKLRATRIASRVGRGFAVALMFGGAIWALLTGDLIDPIWLFVAGFFLLQSSRRQVRRLEISQAVEGMTVGEVMDDRFEVVGPNLTIDTLFDQHERNGDIDTYPVTSDGLLVGSIEVSQIERIPRAQRARTRVTDVMTRLERLQTLTGGQSVMDALMRFERTTTDAIPVVDREQGNHIVGLLTRERLIEKVRPRVRGMIERDRRAESRP